MKTVLKFLLAVLPAVLASFARADWVLAKPFDAKANVATTMTDGMWTLNVVIFMNTPTIFMKGVADCGSSGLTALDLSQPIVDANGLYYTLKCAYGDGTATVGSTGRTFSDFLSSLVLPTDGLVAFPYWRNFENLTSVTPFLPASVRYVGVGTESVFAGNPKLALPLDLSQVIGISGPSSLLVKDSGVTRVTFGAYAVYEASKIDETNADGYVPGAASEGISLPDKLLSDAPDLEAVLFAEPLTASVGDGVFGGCTNLTTLGLVSHPANFTQLFQDVTSLGGGVFADCAKLVGTLELRNLEWGTCGNVRCPKLGGCKASGTKRDNCIGFGSSIGSVVVTMSPCPDALGATFTDYGFASSSDGSYGVFKGMAALTSVEVQASQFTKISASTFSGCESLRSVIFDSPSITSIDALAFYQCGSLSVLKTGRSTTEYDFDLAGVTTFANNSFGGNGSLNVAPQARSVRIGTVGVDLTITGSPKSSNGFYNGLFCRFPRLADAYVQGRSVMFAGGEFSGCPVLKRVTINARKVPTLGVGGTFAKSTSLTSVIWYSEPPASVGVDVFAGVEPNTVVNDVIRSFGWGSLVSATWAEDGRSGTWDLVPSAQNLAAWNPYGGGFVIIGR